MWIPYLSDGTVYVQAVLRHFGDPARKRATYALNHTER
jgi:hypothetical protein